MIIEIQKALIEHEDALQGFFLSETGRQMDYLPNRLKQYPAFNAFLDRKIVGFVNTKRFAPDILEITNLYVAQPYQGRGIGSQLLQGLETYCKKTQWKALILVNSQLYENKDGKGLAQNFYEKNGYQLSFKTSDTLCFYKVL